LGDWTVLEIIRKKSEAMGWGGRSGLGTGDGKAKESM
jgi:hypothetical protein